MPEGCQFNKSENELLEVSGKSWCPFHCPMTDDKGYPTLKSSWNEKQLKEFGDAVKQLIHEAFVQKKVANLIGVVFPIDISFSKNKELPILKFDAAIFCRTTNFSESILPWASFRMASFQGETGFSAARFLNSCSFQGATFQKQTQFFITQFEEGVDFAKTTFYGPVRFGGFQSKNAFQRMVSFKEANFHDETDFGDTVFNGPSSFRKATFVKKSSFKKVTFNGPSLFDEVAFQGEASFASSLFCAETSFENATFDKAVSFRESTFLRKVSFMKSKFKGEVCFVSSGDTNGEENLRANTFPEVNFKEAVFGSHVSFVNRRFLQPANFSGCIFHIAPEFHGCSLHQGCIFPPRANFKDASSEQAVQAYRTLKLAMEQVRARQEEAMFYALEQQSLRAQAKTPFSTKILSLLYQVTANYGENFLRPFIWLIALNIFFWCLYVGIAFIPTGAFAHPFECFQFTIEQLVRPFSAWLPSGGLSLKAYLGSNVFILFMLQLVATFQSIFSLSLFTVGILAIRRKFKLS